MDAVNSCRILGFDYSLCRMATHVKIKAPSCSLPCARLFSPNFVITFRDFAIPRLRISSRRSKGLKHCSRAPRVSCLLEGINDEYKETMQSSFSDDSGQEAAIDLRFPRRSLLITFTCDACGARSQRIINRLAYERGLVYVQCSGCSQYHKLVDNLGLVVEYNLQEEIDMNANTDQA